MKKLILTILFCLMPFPVYATTYYVSATGGDNSRTSVQVQNPATPWLTIQKCADNAIAGDTCSVAAGTYGERVETKASGSEGNLITFYATGLVTMDGAASGFQIEHPYIKIYGDSLASSFNISNGSGNGGEFGLIYINTGAHHVTVDKVTVHNASASVSYHKGILIYSAVGYNTISNCDIYENNYTNVLLMNSPYNTFENNAIHDSSADAFVFTGDYNTFRGNSVINMRNGNHVDMFQVSALPEGARYAVIENNISYGHESMVSLGQFESNSDGVTDRISNFTIRNNVFCDFYGNNMNGPYFGWYNNVFCNRIGSAAGWAINMGITEKLQSNNVTIKNNVFWGWGSSTTGWYSIGTVEASGPWTPNTAISAGTIVSATSPNNYHVYIAANSGTTGGTEPDWDSVGIISMPATFTHSSQYVTVTSTANLRTNMAIHDDPQTISYVNQGKDHITAIVNGTTFTTNALGYGDGTPTCKFHRQPNFSSVSVAGGPVVVKTGSYTRPNTYITVSNSTGIVPGMIVSGCYMSINAYPNNFRYVTSVDGTQVNINAASTASSNCANTTFGFFDDYIIDNTGENEIHWVIAPGTYGTVADYNYVAGLSYEDKIGFPKLSFDTNGINGGNPYFTDAANYDFTISNVASVLRNAGATIASFSTDRTGLYRPQGAAWDIGPYEYNEDSPTSYTYSSSGGFIIGGSATVVYIEPLTHTGVGGIVLGGESTVILSQNVTGAGGMILGGESPYNVHRNDPMVITSVAKVVYGSGATVRRGGTVIASQTPTADCDVTVDEIGNRGIGGTSQTFTPNSAWCELRTADLCNGALSGALTTAYLYHANSNASTARICVYSDNGDGLPGASDLKLGCSDATVDNMTLGWSEALPMDGGVVTPGSNYWLCIFIDDDTSYAWITKTGTTVNIKYRSNTSIHDYDSPPATLSGSWNTAVGYGPLSAYVTLD